MKEPLRESSRFQVLVAGLLTELFLLLLSFIFDAGESPELVELTGELAQATAILVSIFIAGRSYRNTPGE